MSNDSHLSTILFFSLGLLFVQICFVFYLIIQRSTFIEYYIRQCDNAKKNEEIEFEMRCHAASINSKQIIVDENVRFRIFFFFDLIMKSFSRKKILNQIHRIFPILILVF
jgi:hypothetical protein